MTKKTAAQRITAERKRLGLPGHISHRAQLGYIYHPGRGRGGYHIGSNERHAKATLAELARLPNPARHKIPRIPVKLQRLAAQIMAANPGATLQRRGRRLVVVFKK